ncbi:MAG: ribose 5-phosphate isomerase B [Candidatus Acidiferrales bacterium]
MTENTTSRPILIGTKFIPFPIAITRVPDRTDSNRVPAMRPPVCNASERPLKCREMAESASKPRIALGADHAGFHLKETVKQFLAGEGYACDDLGTSSEESVDYPDFARAVAERVAAGEAQLGILACGTGIGMAIAADKVPGVRAANAFDEMTARLAREHNDANVLTLGARILDDARAIEVVRTFLAAQFAGGRHQRRIDKISEIDRSIAAAHAAATSATASPTGKNR